MIFLKDFKTSFNKKCVVLGLIFGILGILVTNIIYLSILFFILSFFFVLFANRFQKYFEGHFKEKVSVKDSMDAVLRDKNGNIKTERHSS
ncbi:MAG: hypothetical protein Q8P47_00335 [Candidatus Beckwithbacteria bacterium]|nr:hypothetical protein [Candidatus Beckwithbacteria bacterium]